MEPGIGIPCNKSILFGNSELEVDLYINCFGGALTVFSSTKDCFSSFFGESQQKNNEAQHFFCSLLPDCYYLDLAFSAPKLY